tara:strand:+ start:3506 stop:3784 length:279 start_codon:yes stop_codon:yes gene_type:complete
MAWMKFLFAPRTDHRGWSTPSEAARLFFLIALVWVAMWAWGNTDGNIVMWLGLTLLVVTPVLSVGWWLISLVSQRFTPLVLMEAVNNVKKKS